MYILSLVIGAKDIRATVYNEEYKQLSQKEAEWSNDAIPCAEELLEAMLEGEKITSDNVKYIGVAVGASMNAQTVEEKLEKTTGIKTIARNIIEAKALGEAYVSYDKRSLVMLKIDDEVESAIVIDKKLYFGANGEGAKLSHMIINANGYDLGCGPRGCFEAYVSRKGISRILSDAGIECAEEVLATELFAMSGEAAENAKNAYTNYLASALVNIINLFQPQEMVLEGDFTSVGYNLFKPLMEIVLDEQYTSRSPKKCNVRFSRTQNDTVSLGAALLGR